MSKEQIPDCEVATGAILHAILENIVFKKIEQEFEKVPEIVSTYNYTELSQIITRMENHINKWKELGRRLYEERDNEF